MNDIWEETRTTLASIRRGGAWAGGYSRVRVLNALREERDIQARRATPRLPCCEDAFQHVRARWTATGPVWSLRLPDGYSEPLILEGVCPFCSADLRELIFSPAPGSHYQHFAAGSSSCGECGECAADCYCLPPECAWQAAGEPSQITPSTAALAPTAIVANDEICHLAAKMRSQESVEWDVLRRAPARNLIALMLESAASAA
jgi:hypothetical protein